MKKIKFNLYTNGIGVANLEDLQEHFNIDDIVNHYKSGLLQKWLEVQGLQEELEKLNQLPTEDGNLISKILDIFEIKYSKEDIKEIELSRSYLQDKQRFLEEFKQSENDFNQSFESYLTEFHEVIYQALFDFDKTDTKTNLKRLHDDFWILTLIHLEEYSKICLQDNPLVFFLSLSFPKFRTYFLGESIFKNNVLPKEHSSTIGDCMYRIKYGKEFTIEEKNLVEYFSTIEIGYIDHLSFRQLENRIKASKVLLDQCIQNEIKSPNDTTQFIGNTNGYWKDLVPKTKKVLVLNISQGSLVCAPVSSDEIPKELDSKAVNGNFLILDGLQFKSNNVNYSVTYLEI